MHWCRDVHSHLTRLQPLIGTWRDAATGTHYAFRWADTSLICLRCVPLVRPCGTGVVAAATVVAAGAAAVSEAGAAPQPQWETICVLSRDSPELPSVHVTHGPATGVSCQQARAIAVKQVRSSSITVGAAGAGGLCVDEHPYPGDCASSHVVNSSCNNVTGRPEHRGQTFPDLLRVRKCCCAQLQ